MITPLGILDIVLLIASMALCALIGLYFSNKNQSADAYMLGDRRMSVVPVAISLMTSCMSGLSLLGSSSELYYQGPGYSFIVFAMLMCGPIIAYTILPVFYRMNELSLYKYLERRYGLAIKYLVSLVFIFQMTFYNAVVLYLPSMALQAILGVSKFYSILLIGLMCVLYSSIGGIKAVVWTDFFQAILMYASVFLVGLLGTIDAGGLGKVIENAREGHRLDLDGFLNFDLTTRHTLWAILVGATLKQVYVVGVNQVQIQRALSLASLRQAQIAFILCAIFTALISVLSSYLGLVLYSAYRECDPFLANEIPRRDAIIVHYVASRLHNVPGLRGIFIAGIFSATLSTLSSFANSMAALALEDFVKPAMRLMDRKDLSPSMYTLLAKVLATVFGLICVLMAFVIDKANSRLLQATTTMLGAIGVPFLAAFALGIFTRYTNTVGILAGFSVTLTLGIYFTIVQTFFSDPLMPTTRVTYDGPDGYCASVFNMSMSADQLPALIDFSELGEQASLPPVAEPFALHKISYISLPALQFVLTWLVASLVSILTGGWNQQVSDEWLIAFKHDGQPVEASKSGPNIVRTLEMSAEQYPEQEEAEQQAGNLQLPQHLAQQPKFRAALSSAKDSVEQRKRKLAVTCRSFDESILK